MHLQLYRLFPHAGAVLHGHSIPGTVLSMAIPGASIPLAGYESLEAFEGQDTHDTSLDLPIFDNDQDIPRLCAAAEPRLPGCRPGYLTRIHGPVRLGSALHRPDDP